MKHSRSPPTQIILSEGFMYILRSHCLHLCIPLTLLTKCSCTIPVCYCVYIVKLRAVRDPPPFSAQKCIFFYLCCCLFILPFFRAFLGKCNEMPTCHEVCVCVQRVCLYVCVKLGCQCWWAEQASGPRAERGSCFLPAGDLVLACLSQP